jgi:polyisoprenoid-binding protein YceI
MRFLLAAIAVLVVIGAALAANWRIAPEQSRLGFAATQAGSPFEGAFRRFAAEISFDAADLASSRAVVVIEMASAETGNLERDVALQGSDWFAVSRFPQARFETRGFRGLGNDRFEADADLTIRDVTRPVTVPFTLRPDPDGVRARGEVAINRTAWGVGQGQWASEQWIPHAVTVRFDLLATPLP